VSIVLVGISGRQGEAVIARLIEDDDDVRVIETDPRAARTWSALGARVARADVIDADLVARAAHQARTIALFRDALADVAEVVEGARLASRHIRVIVCAPRLDPGVKRPVETSGLEYVFVRTTRRGERMIGRSRPSVSVLGEVVSAADDLAGELRLDLDLAERSSWLALGLQPR
jgi:TrkA-N domain